MTPPTLSLASSLGPIRIVGPSSAAYLAQLDPNNPDPTTQKSYTTESGLSNEAILETNPAAEGLVNKK